MTWTQAALWGLFGGFAVEGLDFYGAVCRRGCWPWRVRGPREVGAAGYFTAELIRLAIGSGLACASADSKLITTAFGALTVGVAAPLIVERLTRAIPLTDSERETPAVTAHKSPAAVAGSELNGHQVSVDRQRAHANEADEVILRNDQHDQVGE